MSVISRALPASAKRKPAPEWAVNRFEARLHTTFEPILPVWRAMEARGGSGVYQRLDWARGVAAELAEASRAEPLLVVVSERASGRPVMIWPMVLTRRSGLRVIGWLDLGVCDYAAPLVAEDLDLTGEEAAAAWAAVGAVLPPADLIRIERIPAAIHGRPNPLSLLPDTQGMAMRASGMALGGEPDDLLPRLCRRSTLRDLGKQRRRLERAGSVRFSCAGTPEAVDSLFSTLVAQRRRRFAEMGRFDLLARPEIESFYRMRALEGLSGGPVRILSLAVDDEVVATFYGLVHGGTFHGLLLTASSEARWRNASPGIQIACDTLRWACAEKLAYFDFTVGEMPYKRDFGVETRDLDELVEARSLRGAVMLRGLRDAQSLMERLRRHPAAFERLRSLRRGLRRLGASGAAET